MSAHTYRTLLLLYELFVSWLKRFSTTFEMLLWLSYRCVSSTFTAAAHITTFRSSNITVSATKINQSPRMNFFLFYFLPLWGLKSGFTHASCELSPGLYLLSGEFCLSVFVLSQVESHMNNKIVIEIWMLVFCIIILFLIHLVQGILNSNHIQPFIPSFSIRGVDLVVQQIQSIQKHFHEHLNLLRESPNNPLMGQKEIKFW